LPTKLLANNLVFDYCSFVRIFKNRWFARFASKEGIQDSELREMVNTVLEVGLAEVNLGGGVYKVRVARPGEGKAGGYRVIVFYKSESHTFFVYGFAKSNRGNIGQGELKVFKNRSKDAFSLTEKQIDDRLRKGTLIEIF
jgi:hypothetical protein